MRVIICQYGKLVDNCPAFGPVTDCSLNGQLDGHRKRWVRVVATYPYIRPLYGKERLQPELEHNPGTIDLDYLAHIIGERAVELDALYHVYCWQWNDGGSDFYRPLMKAFEKADTSNRLALEKGFPAIAHAKRAWSELGTDWLREIALAMGWLRPQVIPPNASKRKFYRNRIMLESLSDEPLRLRGSLLEVELLEVFDAHTDREVNALLTRRVFVDEDDQFMKSQDVVRHLREECQDDLQDGYARKLLGLNEDGTDVMEFGENYNA